ncbi:speckle-type POZ protein [Caerostris extrusa]|uniref:Speckle-type POZ protein n=1 Tax=Caerostris extrusa TaxID=172846 RepID=A0AAV4M883_CAEEX|nr:speckle-type POZ protein [Caerostris extrusa]
MYQNTNIFSFGSQPLEDSHPVEEVNVVMSSEISILDRRGIPFFLTNQSHFFGQSKYEDVWSLSEIMKTNDLFTKRNLLLPEDVLSLRFEFVASVGEMESLPAEVRAVYPENRCVNPSSTMKDDFYYLYKEQAFSDITLTTGSIHFKAHKAILSCRSPVFKAMFEHDMMENATGAVNIPDVNSETLGRMLFFCTQTNWKKLWT